MNSSSLCAGRPVAGNIVAKAAPGKKELYAVPSFRANPTLPSLPMQQVGDIPT